MTLLEEDIENHFVRLMTQAGLRALKLMPEGVRGWPDRTVPLPGAGLVLVEFKKPDEDLRPDQKRMKKWLTRLGFEYYEVKSKAEADRLAEAIRCRISARI